MSRARRSTNSHTAGNASSHSIGQSTPNQPMNGYSAAYQHARNATPDPSTSLSFDQLQQLRRQSNLSTISLSPKPPASHSTRTTRPRHSAAGDMTADDDTPTELNLIDRMRNWRNDGMTQHLYETAQFWGNKVFQLTREANDAFWLAQAYFYTHEFSQAEKILTTPTASTSGAAGSARLTETSLACRYLAGQCLVRLGKWEQALEMMGTSSNWTAEDDDVNQPSDGGIKLTAATAHLRGLIYLHLGANDQAKICFLEALSRDVKCYESFRLLVSSSMMSSEEEWQFITNLAYAQQTGPDAEFIRLTYRIQLQPGKHSKEIDAARKTLVSEFGLSSDPDILYSHAIELHDANKFAQALKITSQILAGGKSHRASLSLHLNLLHSLPKQRTNLFSLAHKLIETAPDDCISWYAVGLWYYANRQFDQARRFFGKSVLLDSRFAPSWLCFGHSYALEGEHDQAITAYSTALRHSQGSHLPQLFIGMQHSHLMNLNLAQEYLKSAKQISADADPLAANELGVVRLRLGEFAEAAELFSEALQLAKNVQASPRAWITTRLNLGHAYRKLNRWQDAETSFRQVIELDPRCASAYSALGYVEHRRGRYTESIARYHEALSLNPGDPVTCDLLKLVLDDAASDSETGFYSFPGLSNDVMATIDRQVAELERDVMAGSGVSVSVPEPSLGNGAAEQSFSLEEGATGMSSMDMST